MSAYIGSHRQQPREKLTYNVDYSPWLDSGSNEYISSTIVEIDVATSPPLVVGTVIGTPGTSNFTGLKFDVSGGITGQQYQVTLRVTTTEGQIVEREILYIIEEL